MLKISKSGRIVIGHFGYKSSFGANDREICETKFKYSKQIYMADLTGCPRLARLKNGRHIPIRGTEEAAFRCLKICLLIFIALSPLSTYITSEQGTLKVSGAFPFLKAYHLIIWPVLHLFQIIQQNISSQIQN